MSDILARICADKREELAGRKRRRRFASLYRDARLQPRARPFFDRLARVAASGGYGLIAEFKRASPSKGLIRPGAEPGVIASAYAESGATCLSVLTESRYFQGSDEDLVTARAAVDLPVLRKDFTIDPYQVAEARVIGADCVLVILAAVDDSLARDLLTTASELGMTALCEVHNRAELDRALGLEARLIGINNRNLRTFAVDLSTTEALAMAIPDAYRDGDFLVVCESGINAPTDLHRMAGVGVRTFLVGEALMRSEDVAAATRTLLGR